MNTRNFGICTGRAVAQPKICNNQDGSRKILLTLACQDNWKNDKGEYPVQFIDLEAFIRGDKPTNGGFDYIAKGTMITAEYSVRSNSWKDDKGETHHRQVLAIQSIDLISQPKNQQNGQTAYQQNTQPFNGQPVYQQNPQPVYQQYGQPVPNNSQPVYQQYSQPFAQNTQPVYQQYGQPVPNNSQPVYQQNGQPFAQNTQPAPNNSQPVYQQNTQPVPNNSQPAPNNSQPAPNNSQPVVPNGVTELM